MCLNASRTGERETPKDFATCASSEYLASLHGLSPWAMAYFVIDVDRGQSVGFAGFKGPPSPAGVVEIAYATAAEFQNCGYASAAARKMVALALSQPDTTRVVAHTLPCENSSGRVLTKCGFTLTGEVIDPEDGPVWRWETSSPDRI